MKVLADEPVAGIADRAAAVLAEADGDTAGDRLAFSLAADGMSLPAERRGLPDIGRRIIDRLRGMRLVEELGEVDATFEIVGLHVPPAGKAALQMRSSATVDNQVSIIALGSGFGRGRSLTLSVDEEIPERDRCMVILQHVTLAVRRLARGDDSMLRTDVVGWSNQEHIGMPSCVHCGVPGDDLDPLEFEEDEQSALDLRLFDTAVTRRHAWTLTGKRKADIGVDWAGKAGAGFRIEQQTTISCTPSYTFAAGRWFVPYRRRGDTAALPYWAVR